MIFDFVLKIEVRLTKPDFTKITLVHNNKEKIIPTEVQHILHPSALGYDS